MSANKANILVVDDEIGVCYTIKDILEDEGYRVSITLNGRDAIEAIRDNSFNVAIIDINLPDISGLEILKSIRSLNLDLYSIMLTAAATIENSIKALNQGAYAYIVKPFQIEQFKDTVKRATDEQHLVLENKKLLRELQISNVALKEAKMKVDDLNRALESKIRQRTRELNEQKERTEAIIESLADGLCTVDEHWCITSFNRQAEKITGYRADEVIGKHHSEIFKSQNSEYTKQLMEALKNKETVSHMEVYIQNRNHQTIPIRVSAAILRDKKGRITGAVQNFRDITEQKQLQEQLIQASKLASMGELLANFTHEIKNPLNGMLLFASLIQSELKDKDSELADYADRILQEGTRIGKIASDILTFSRQNRQEYHLEDVTEILETTLALTEHQLQLDGIQVIREFEPDLPKIAANSGRLQQVFLNLINNAQYALNKKSPGLTNNNSKILRLSINKVEHGGKPYIRIKVYDNGIGIPQKYFNKLFDPFFTTKPVGQGTGLGLSVSYGIIQDHQGTIDVESRVSEYTIFTIDLPAADSSCMDIPNV
ncbi:MAG: PAS domain S-box protein [bacterium]|nr:PAS domain S-box protein [bacterium]